MSGLKLSRKQRLAGKIGAAAVIATMAGVPQDLVSLVTGSIDSSNIALAGKSPPPPPPPATPLPEKLNNDPNVRWFAAWTQQTEPGTDTNFFATPSNILGIPTVQTTLNNSALANKPLGIKVETTLSPSDASSLFNSKYPMPSGTKAISWVFEDNETGTSAQQITNFTNLVNQVRTSTWSNQAYVGKYDLVPLSSVGTSTSSLYVDPTRRGALFFTKAQYDSSKANMANTELYPGAASYRNKSTNDWANANIRTGLFFGPIGRMTAVQNALDASYGGTDTLGIGLTKHKQIPWVTRFNNWGNSSLDTDQNPANGYAFVPGAPLNNGFVSLNGAQTANQMMGRGDFQAQIMHYRSRGAYSVNIFHEGGANGGVVGYSEANSREDVRYGWAGVNYGGNTDTAAQVAAVQHMNNIFAQTDNKRATMTTNPLIDGTSASGGMRSEISGTIWSGVYSLSLKQLDILASNLDSTGHNIKFGTVDIYDVFCVKNGSGYTYADSMSTAPSRNSLIEAGVHRLLQFDLVTTRVYNSLNDMNAGNNKYKTQTIWLLNQNYLVFTNNNRNDVGIPEPTTFGMLAAAGSMAMICRRSRGKKQLA